MKLSEPKNTAIKLFVLLLIVAVAGAAVFAYKRSKEPAQPAGTEKVAAAAASPAAHADGKLVPVFALIDGVGLYSKHGRVEIYGADLRQRRNAPISVAATELHLKANEIVLAWYPDFSPAAGSRFVEISFGDALPLAGRVSVGVELATGDTVAFRYDFASKPVAEDAAAHKRVPADLRALIDKVPAHALELRGRQLIGTLPEALVAALAAESGADKLIRTWFLVFEGIEGELVRLSSVALAAGASSDPPPVTVTLAGRTRGISARPGRYIELVSEDGKRTRQELSLDGAFNFGGLAAGKPVSLRINHNDQDYFATDGRWFAPRRDRSDVVIDFAPRYSNPTSAEPDPKRVAFQSTGSVEIIEEYQPHSRQIWNGYAGYPQEFDNIGFANNIGHIDRDRFADNADKCYRILAFGASLSVAVQVPLFEKFNAILEEELGIALGRCVEVISLGRNNGDIGANYPRLRKFGPLFAPDMLLFENSAGVMFQLQPDLVRKLLGYDFDKSPLDHFSRDKSGVLEFVPWNTGWAVFSAAPDTASLQKNVPFMETFSVPPQRMRREAQEAYRMLADISQLYRKQYPQATLALFTALEQVKCRGKCWSEVQLESGETVRLGAEAFLRNMAEFCSQQSMVCFNPAVPGGIEESAGNYLTWKNDSHLNVRGHQWLARELSRLIHAHLRKP